jgi:hypothetical protein
MAGPTEKTCHVISKHCCVTSLRMCKLHRHKENAAAILLAVCMLRALSSGGFTCHNTILLTLFLGFLNKMWANKSEESVISHLCGGKFTNQIF